MYEVLPVELTDNEILTYSARLTTMMRDRDAEERAAKDAAGLAKQRLAEQEADIKKLASIIREKREPRQVECYEEKNWTRKTVDIIRRDLNEVVSSRAMTLEEMQRPLTDVLDDVARG